MGDVDGRVGSGTAADPARVAGQSGIGQSGIGQSGIGRRAVLFLPLAAAAAACSSSGGGGTGTGGGGNGGGGGNAPSVTMAPANGATNVTPDAPVTVTAHNGRLTAVTVSDSANGTVNGTLSADGTAWNASGGLDFGQTYTVTATVVGADGKGTPQRFTFTTMATPPNSQLVKARIAPLTGETVGMGMPVWVELTNAVTDPVGRANIERALKITSTPSVPGSWHWLDSTHVAYRPRDYWPKGTTVSLAAHLTGVNAGGGRWGGNSNDVTFTIGDAIHAQIDGAAHTMVVTVNGQPARTVPVTLGKDGFNTRTGIKVTYDKNDHIHMDSTTVGIPKGSPDYYSLDVDWAVRVTLSGEFIHSAPWSVGSQGSANVSHGCVGLAPDVATWFFNLVHKRGDVVEVVNSGGKPMETYTNGYGYWNASWEDWAAGSALTGGTSASPAA